jgi:FAD/FMN-containing dehydrogenase
VRQAGREIMETCVRAGGSITGEHGVGLDKSSYLPLIFSNDDLAAMMQVRAAFDPLGLCNPGKIIPAPKGCGEARAVATVTEPLAVASGSASLSDFVASERASLSQPHPGKAPQKHNLITARVHEGRIANQLTEIVGDVGVRRLVDLQVDLKANGRVERILEIAPATEEQAQEVIRFAARANLAVVPAGAKTRVAAGNLLTRADLILSARRLNRVVSHEPADLIATAQAGVPVNTFQESLAQAGQFLPIDSADRATTLGGIFARGERGPSSPGFGRPASFVIGMHVILADGRLIKAGGKVVKNVAGYDLCKLFTGSYGTLGFITELTFKLRPLPAEMRTVMVSGDVSSLIECGRLIAKQLSPLSVEVLSPGMHRQLRASGGSNEHALLLSFAGSERAVIWQTAQALKIAREKNGKECVTLEEHDDIWRNLNAAAVSADCDLVWTALVKQTNVYSFLQEIAAVEKDASHFRWHAGVADGRIRVMGRAPIYHREAVRALEQLRHKAQNFGGSLIIEKAPREIKNEFDAWGDFGSAAPLMRRVKSQLDPQNMFSPGRMFG